MTKLALRLSAAVLPLLAGDEIETALHEATRMATRNVGFRGASGLSQHLRGELVTP